MNDTKLENTCYLPATYLSSNWALLYPHSCNTQSRIPLAHCFPREFKTDFFHFSMPDRQNVFSIYSRNGYLPKYMKMLQDAAMFAKKFCTFANNMPSIIVPNSINSEIQQKA